MSGFKKDFLWGGAVAANQLEVFIGIKEKDKADKVLESCECAMTVHHGGYSNLSEVYGGWSAG